MEHHPTTIVCILYGQVVMEMTEIPRVAPVLYRVPYGIEPCLHRLVDFRLVEIAIKQARELILPSTAHGLKPVGL